MLPILTLLAKLWRDPARGLNALYQKHGPIFEVPLLGRKVWLGMGPEIHDVLFKTHVDVCSTSVGSAPVEWLVGRPVGTLDGEAHRRVRRILQSANQLKRVGPVLAETVDAAIETWDNVGIWEVTRRLSFDAILRAGLGANREQARRLEHLFDEFAHALFAPNIPLPFTRHSRGLRARAQIDAWIETHVEHTRRHLDDRGDILATLVRFDETGRSDLNPTELLDNLRLLVFAGQETTASVLAWAIIELAQDRDLWHALVDEVPADAPTPTTLGEARRSPLLDALVNEALRRYTPSWFIGRGVESDELQVLGHDVPRDQILAGSALGTHHMDPLWPDPFRFDVSRWLSKRDIAPGTFWPFGGGPHVCLGAAFSTLEMLQALFAVVRRRRRPVLAGDYDLRPVLLDLPHPPADIRVVFQGSS